MPLPLPSMAPIAVRASRALRPIALLTMLALAGATTSFMLALTPAQERLMRVEAAYEDARLAHSRQTSMLKTEEELKDRWQELPVRKEFAALILAVSELAQQDRVAIPGMTYTLQKVEDGLALKASMTFRAAGEYRAIRRFIYRLETTGPYLLIESLDASRSAGGTQTPAGRVVINIRVVTFLRPDQLPPGGA